MNPLKKGFVYLQIAAIYTVHIKSYRYTQSFNGTIKHLPNLVQVSVPRGGLKVIK